MDVNKLKSLVKILFYFFIFLQTAKYEFDTN